MISKVQKLFLIFIISFSIIEAIVYYNNILIYEKINKSMNFNSNKSLEQLYDECKCIENGEIINAQKENNTWNIKIKIKGNKEDIEGQIFKLQKSKIKSYIIWKNGEENNAIIEICGK